MTNALNTTATIHHATRAKAERLIEEMRTYPALTLVAVESDGKVTGFRTDWAFDGEEHEVLVSSKVPAFSDVLLACEALELDAEAGMADNGDGSVVPEEYRQKYRTASTTGQSCGDWLAEWLTVETRVGDEFVQEAFQAVLVNNQLDLSRPWAKLPESGQKGWIGRWRMNGRQALEVMVAVIGYIYNVKGEREKVPAKALADLRNKHAKKIAKLQKQMDKARKQKAA